ncbi:hypothetical protein JQ636_40550 [Bradyrhizobium japonicum]|uniref:hypothetical protein n=1 Tax=Bradyrhizobium japonicum TaxID=375 RepID=UPI001BA862CB|nr:hypothetical protein [Bradyrhizobium japonicum]MBR0731091.1 hypothetical protein [Bradyrhizobium japonicum]MBR0809849.1 hypothetical protein [Bradyrhizobium japonicum]
MSSFVPVNGPLVMMGEATVSFSFSSAYATSILVELWSDEDTGASYFQNQNTVTDGQNEPSLVLTGFPLQMDLHYRITVTGEEGSENTVHVSIDW